MERNLRAEALATIMKDMVKEAEKIERYADQIEKFEAAMDRVFVNTGWDLRYRSGLTIQAEELSTVRKVVGRMKMTGKSLAYDYERSGDVIISLKPCSQEFDALSFNYRRKFRNGGRCKVVEQSSTYQTLVCQK